MQSHIVKPVGSLLCRWVASKRGWVKYNFDGVAKGNLGNVGGGGVFRDHHGCHLLIFSIDYGIESNNLAKAQVALWGIMIAKDKGWRRLWIERDFKLVIEVLSGGPLHNWRLSMVVDATIYVLSELEEIKISHIGKKGNKVVDWAANEGVKQNCKVGNTSKTWDCFLPLEFQSIINEE